MKRIRSGNSEFDIIDKISMNVIHPHGLLGGCTRSIKIRNGELTIIGIRENEQLRTTICANYQRIGFIITASCLIRWK